MKWFSRVEQCLHGFYPREHQRLGFFDQSPSLPSVAGYNVMAGVYFKRKKNASDILHVL